jgi:CBS domain-containing protein
MRVSEAMEREVPLAHPHQTIEEIMCVMARIDAGVLPVGEDGRLIGLITHRDITMRAFVAGPGPATPVGDVMRRNVKFCFDDEDTRQVARNMADQQLQRRLLVVKRNKRLVGVLSFGDLAISQGHARGVKRLSASRGRRRSALADVTLRRIASDGRVGCHGYR